VEVVACDLISSRVLPRDMPAKKSRAQQEAEAAAAAAEAAAIELAKREAEEAIRREEEARLAEEARKREEAARAVDEAEAVANAARRVRVRVRTCGIVHDYTIHPDERFANLFAAHRKRTGTRHAMQFLHHAKVIDDQAYVHEVAPRNGGLLVISTARPEKAWGYPRADRPASAQPQPYPEGTKARAPPCDAIRRADNTSIRGAGMRGFDSFIAKPQAAAAAASRRARPHSAPVYRWSFPEASPFLNCH